jgi:predicted DsbA family dithiol-disulfide isomerase
MADSATAAGASAGITMNFSSALVANTFDAHRLIWFAGSPQAVPYGADADTQQHVVEALHAAHFTHGRDIADVDTLVAVAASVGLDAARVEKLLRSDEGVAEINAELSEARDLGVTSVPTFVFAGKYAVTGAQDPATLASVLDEVARRENLSPTLVGAAHESPSHDHGSPGPAAAVAAPSPSPDHTAPGHGHAAPPAGASAGTPRIPTQRTGESDA